MNMASPEIGFVLFSLTPKLYILLGHFIIHISDMNYAIETSNLSSANHTTPTSNSTLWKYHLIFFTSLFFQQKFSSNFSPFSNEIMFPIQTVKVSRFLHFVTSQPFIHTNKKNLKRNWKT